MWGHFALTILPTLINGRFYERVQMLILFFTGVGVSFALAYAGDPETAFDEAPSLWCLVAIPQHLVTFFAAIYYQAKKHSSYGGGSASSSMDLDEPRGSAWKPEGSGRESESSESGSSQASADDFSAGSSERAGQVTQENNSQRGARR
eukprot:CAMPEP_0172626338 /NCGR_PEP_ID=MMETSP1068-20121228/149725_1 /TAXON_ID=35684 /ORGANISM="Pseudopedinella elastica, Strain CCMP716" /LENGTH=147 /DNA_ID=CAMNT_0013435927 /DNA_START=1 /DNA_END=441 /DNA_ORIENTATION=+